jgi:hypothetical protein
LAVDTAQAQHAADYVLGIKRGQLGAVSPVLVWQGAQAKGMTTMDLPATGRYYQFDVEGV